MAGRISDDGRKVRFGATRAAAAAPRGAARGDVARAVSDTQTLFPGLYDMALYRGDTYEWIFQFQDGQETPIDITGWRFKAEFRRTPDDYLMASLQEVGRDAVAGTITMRLTADQSRMLSTNGVWDLEAVTNEGWVRTVIRGSVTVTTDVSTGNVDYSRSYTTDWGT